MVYTRYRAAETRIASISSCASPRSVKIFRVSTASNSLIRAIAKPTWINTQSLTQDSTGCVSLTIHAMFTCRLTPLTSTVASILTGSSMVTIRPGIPRHIIWSLSIIVDVDEVCSTDGRLAQCKPPIVSGNLRMGKHVEALQFKAATYFFKQDAILETAPGKSDGGKARGAHVMLTR